MPGQREATQEHPAVKWAERKLASGEEGFNWISLAHYYAKYGLQKEAEYARDLHNITEFEREKGLARTFAPLSCEYRSAVRLLEHRTRRDGTETGPLCRVMAVAAEHLKRISDGEATPIDSNLYPEMYADEVGKLDQVVKNAVLRDPIEIMTLRAMLRIAGTNSQARQEISGGQLQ